MFSEACTSYFVWFLSNLIHWWLLLDIVGVAFLKAVPEGTYDAVIVDSSDPIGNGISANIPFVLIGMLV